MLVTSKNTSLDSKFREKGLRYTTIPGVIRRYSVEVSYDKVKSIASWLENFEGVSVIIEAIDNRKPNSTKTHEKPKVKQK